MRLLVNRVTKDDIFQDIVRVDRSHRPGIRAGQLCQITVEGRTIFAIARGAPGNDGIWLDDEMRSRLALKDGEIAEFDIKKARWDQEFTWLWSSGNPVNRTAGRLGVISLILGLIGLALGVVALFR